jgi:hypothetical protein
MVEPLLDMLLHFAAIYIFHDLSCTRQAKLSFSFFKWLPFWHSIASKWGKTSV